MPLIDYLPPRPEFTARPGERDYEAQVIKFQQASNSYNSLIQSALNEVTERGATERELAKARHEAIMEAARKFGG
ncbi:MAG: hypothetical protein WKF30_11285 [Pyrinomonadaceae bacterium]